MKKSKPQQALLFRSIKRSGGTAGALIMWHKHKKGATGLLPLAFMKRQLAHRCEEVQCKHVDVLRLCTHDPLFTYRLCIVAGSTPYLWWASESRTALGTELQHKALAPMSPEGRTGFTTAMLFFGLDCQERIILCDLAPIICGKE